MKINDVYVTACTVRAITLREDSRDLRRNCSPLFFCFAKSAADAIRLKFVQCRITRGKTFHYNAIVNMRCLLTEI